ncbi:MAG: hypothetical protein M0024_10520 [Nitrospiraceae bacterium]|nr:hypothetical protein [Nitrospiraceae bacterium]
MPKYEISKERKHFSSWRQTEDRRFKSECDEDALMFAKDWVDKYIHKNDYTYRLVRIDSFDSSTGTVIAFRDDGDWIRNDNTWQETLDLFATERRM